LIPKEFIFLPANQAAMMPIRAYAIAGTKASGPAQINHHIFPEKA